MLSLKRLLPLVVLASMAAPSLAQDAALKIGIANPAKIFNEMQETRDLKQKLETDRKRLETEERERRDKIRALKEARDQIKPDTPQFAEKNKEFLEEAVRFEAWGKLMQAEVARNQRQQMKQLFDKIQAGVQEVAQAKGLDLVIADQRPEITDEMMENINVEQLRSLINSRTVLFSGPKADITADVLAQLNSKYSAKK